MKSEFCSTGVRDEFCNDILSWEDEAEWLWCIHVVCMVCLLKYL